MKETNKFELISSNKLLKTMTISRPLNLLTFGEDIVITLNPVSENQTRIAIGFASKKGFFIGRGFPNWGQHSRNINEILELLSKRLEAI
jgi:hypothetical protein